MNKALVPVLAAVIFSGANDLALAQDPSLRDPALLPFTQTLALGPAQTAREVPSWDSGRADSIPPAGVRFGRPVAEGQWLLSYHYERQELDGLRSGRDNRSTSELFAAGFTTLSTEATFHTHRFEVHHGLGDGWTVFAGVPFLDREMGNWATGGRPFTTDASGIGDVFAGGIYDWRAGDGDLVRFNLGFSFPTGSVDERDSDEDGASFLLPYPMQLGTGTHDVLPGVTLLVQESSWSWGLQAQGRFPLDTNTEGWAQDRHLVTSAWAAKGWSREVSTSLRVQGLFTSDIHGRASEADPTRNPLESNANQGGDRIDVAAGVQWLMAGGGSSGFSNLLTAEAAVPVDEWLSGPQLSTDWTLVAGWQVSF